MAALKERLRKWTSDVLIGTGHAAITETEFNAYLGLEIATAICPLNDIADYWSTSRCLRKSAFIDTMTRTRFQQIRGSLTLHPPQDSSFDKEKDPLWCCRGVMEQKRFAEFAVPVGVRSLDEMTVATKARTRAKTFIPSKPTSMAFGFTPSWGGVHCMCTHFGITRRAIGRLQRLLSAIQVCFLLYARRSPIHWTPMMYPSKQTQQQLCG